MKENATAAESDMLQCEIATTTFISLYFRHNNGKKYLDGSVLSQTQGLLQRKTWFRISGKTSSHKKKIIWHIETSC